MAGIKKCGKRQKSVRIIDVIPEEVADPLAVLLDRIRVGDLRGESAYLKLVELLEPHRDYLMTKGLLVEFLATVLEERAAGGE